MLIWTLAKKDLRLLFRDRRALIILLVMPLVFVFVLGLSLGEGFGQKPDDRLRVSIVDQDRGLSDPVQASEIPFGARTWSEVIRRDLGQTADIRIETMDSREEAEQAVRSGKRAAVFVFGPEFSERAYRCSFLADGINPFFRDGVKLSELDAELLRDETQLTAGSIIDQVGQVTLLRVILPWMIGRAFEKLGDPAFMEVMGREVGPLYEIVPEVARKQLGGAVQRAFRSVFRSTI